MPHSLNQDSDASKRCATRFEKPRGGIILFRGPYIIVVLVNRMQKPGAYPCSSPLISKLVQGCFDDTVNLPWKWRSAATITGYCAPSGRVNRA